MNNIKFKKITMEAVIEDLKMLIVNNKDKYIDIEHSIFRGELVFLKVKKEHLILEEDYTMNTWIRILSGRMRYYTVIKNDQNYSLYRIDRQQEKHYFNLGYLVMEVGKFDIYEYTSFHKLYA
ncbi:hypothetical protein RH915_03160 [Serpentinicella sp. ANB-PHB4]|uniref:hypothetical protein n=1 Tax=Serpentinicella sp. ANB-PHB4 TaxID=3074076 RepID=UPI00285C84DF|nr:hypothetical protein [Serpentinicella sp. ANB-PHB4]MDR5658481.1 hypothetical protein [Serpentinicella sp. ANB-PHB4]